MLPPPHESIMASEPTLLLYEAAASSYVQKIKIALREKGIPFTTKVPADLVSNATSGPLHSSNPRLEVPVFVDGDLQIFESTIILEYIEDKFPTPPLLPKDPAGRARARMIEDLCDNEYEATNWGLGELTWFKRAEGDLAKELERQGRHHVGQLQAWLSDMLGDAKFFGGEKFGYADAAAAPIVNRSVTMGVPPQGRLAEWLDRIKEREAVKQTFEEYDRAVPGMHVFAKKIADGEAKREYRSSRLEWMIKAGGLDVVAKGLEANNIRFTWPDNIK